MARTKKETTFAEIQQTFDDAGWGHLTRDDIEITIAKMDGFVAFTIFQISENTKEIEHVKYWNGDRKVKAVEFSETQTDQDGLPMPPMVVVVDFGDVRAIHYRNKWMRERAKSRGRAFARPVTLDQSTPERESTMTTPLRNKPWREDTISILESSLNDIENLRLSIAGEEYDADQAEPIRDDLASIEDKISDLIYILKDKDD